MMRITDPVCGMKKGKMAAENSSCVEGSDETVKKTISDGVFDLPKIPDLSKPNNDKFIVLMDIDHTMIKSEKFYSKKVAENFAASLPKGIEYWQVDSGIFPGMVWHASLRPGIRKFFQEVASFAELHIFTAGCQKYAEDVAKLLDPDGRYFSPDRCWSRDGPYIRWQGNDYFKQLSKLPLGRKDLSRVVLIDDYDNHQLENPGNVYLIDEFHHNPGDSELECALDFLKSKLKDCDDVRPILREREKEERELRSLMQNHGKRLTQTQINRYLSSAICL